MLPDLGDAGPWPWSSSSHPTGALSEHSSGASRSTRRVVVEESPGQTATSAGRSPPGHAASTPTVRVMPGRIWYCE